MKYRLGYQRRELDDSNVFECVSCGNKHIEDEQEYHHLGCCNEK